MDRPINELIDQAYTRSPLVVSMLACLQDSDCCQWISMIWKEIRVVMANCRVVSGHIYIGGKLFLSPDDELRIQAIYHTYFFGPGRYLGHTKTLDLLNRIYW